MAGQAPGLQKRGSVYLLPAFLAARIVFGYYPSWQAGQESFAWDLLTHVAVFDVSVSSTGTLSGTSFWRSSQVGALIAEAHQHQVKVVLTVTNFDATSMHALLSSQAARQAATDALTQEGLGMQPGDGIDVDFEGLAMADRDAFTSWVAALTQAVHARKPSAEVSLAMPAVDWSHAYDVAGLAAASDLLMIMGYDYHWRTSAPGPVAPLSTGPPWSSRDVESTVADYTSALGAAGLAKLVLGMPLYGYDYPSTSAVAGASATGAATAVVYRSARVQAQQYGRQWDQASQTPWYVYQSGGAWHQVWYDDEQSLGLKIDLALREGLGGIGLWALGYEDGSFWEVVRAKWMSTGQPDGGVVPAPDAGADATPPPPSGGSGMQGGCAAAPASRPDGPVSLLFVLVLLYGRRARRS